MNGDMSPYTIGILVKKLSDSQQVMEARVLAIKHIQTLKLFYINNYDMIKNYL